MKVLCDENIPPRLRSALSNKPSLDVLDIHNKTSKKPIDLQTKDQVVWSSADVLLTCDHKMLLQQKAYGVIHYANPAAKHKTVANRVASIARQGNPYTNIKLSVP